MYISDKYLTNVFSIEKDKNGKNRYYLYDTIIKDETIPKGKLILPSKANEIEH